MSLFSVLMAEVMMALSHGLNNVDEIMLRNQSVKLPNSLKDRNWD